MGQNRFAAVTRAVRSIPSRRDVLRGLAGAGLGLGIARLPDLAEAKKKRKRKHKKKEKKVRPNEFGCFEVGDLCRSEADCCSGICEGKKGKLTCRAHDTGSCDQDLEKSVCEVVSIEDALKVYCDNSTSCGCFRTTSDSLYCSQFLYTTNDPRCADCRTDADCAALGFPPQAACAPVATGICTGACPTGMACLVPCGTELPNTT